jgi:PIN domain nuclease of toxin-antitoxin system
VRLLLDTHILLWWSSGDRRLVKTLRSAIASDDNDVAVSAATFWEIAIKKQLGRIDIDLGELLAAVRADGFEELAVRAAHTLQLDSLPGHHRDPFDRILIAQSIAEGRRLVTRDEAILAYSGVAGFDPLSA